MSELAESDSDSEMPELIEDSDIQHSDSEARDQSPIIRPADSNAASVPSNGDKAVHSSPMVKFILVAAKHILTVDVRTDQARLPYEEGEMLSP